MMLTPSSPRGIAAEVGVPRAISTARDAAMVPTYLGSRHAPTILPEVPHMIIDGWLRWRRSTRSAAARYAACFAGLFILPPIQPMCGVMPEIGKPALSAVSYQSV